MDRQLRSHIRRSLQCFGPKLHQAPRCSHQHIRSWKSGVQEPATSFQAPLLPHSWIAGIGAGILSAALLLSPGSGYAQDVSPTSLAETKTQAAFEAERVDLPPIPTSFPPLPEVKPAPYQQVVLPNGLRVFLLEDHEVPLIQGVAVMRGGQYASPSNKLGVASLFSSVQRSGGTLAHPRQVLDERLEELAAGIDAGAGRDATLVQFLCAKEDVQEVLGLWSEVIRTPALPEEMVQLQKSQIVSTLQHKNDNPSIVARRELGKLIYGKDSIYARDASISSVEALARKDLVQFKETWQRPDSASVGLVGDFDSEEMLSLVKQALGDWQAARGQPATPVAVAAPVPQPRVEDGGVVYLVDRPGLTQASVASGELGLDLLNPDTSALDVLGTIFNSFGGRLFDEIRSKDGLAYSVSGGWDAPLKHPGMFMASGQTSKPAEFLQDLRRVLRAATEAAPSTDEVEVAKNQVLNQFVFSYASTSAQLQRVLVFDLLGLPQDYELQYNQRLAVVQADDILNAAKSHLHPEMQTVVMVADKKEIEPELKAAGLRPQMLQLDKE